MAEKLSLEEFRKKLDSEPKLKAELSQKLQAVLKDMGMQDQDVNNLAATKSDQQEAVFVSTSDSKKNTRSIIIF
jgi:hypothetical protein